jgi:TP901 family phage tail tape measure protein
MSMATANVIRQRITLDGAKEVEDALKSIGAVGEAAWRKLQAAMGGSGGPTVPPIVNSLKDIQKEFQAAGKAFEEVGTKMRNVGAGFSLFLSAPLTLAGKDVIKTAADFESAMTTLQIATQSTGQEFDALREKARQIGKDTMFDPSQAAQAMTELAKTGVSTKDILNGAADAVVKLATANEADLAPSAKMLSDVMQQFKIKVGDIPAAVDKISGAINLSKLDFNDYQLAVSQAGQVVGSTGGNFDDFNAALTATSSAFASGSDAGTSFKTFMQNLIPQTDKASAQMLKFGLATQDSSGKIKSAFFTSSGQFKGFAAAADLLKSKLGGLSDAAKTEVFHDLFGTDSSRTALKLMDVGSKGLREITDQIKKYDASLAVTQRMKTFNGQLEQLNGSFQELKIAIGDSGVLEAATKFVKVLADLVEEASKANPVFLKWGFILGGLAAAIGPVVGAIGLMLIGWGKVASTTGSLVGAFANVIAKGGALGSMFRGLAGATKLLGNPWIELGILLISNWKHILDAAKQFYEGIFGDPTKVTSKWIKDWSLAINDLVSAIKKALSGDFTGAFNSLKKAGQDALNGLKEFFSGSFGSIAQKGIAAFAALRIAGVAMSKTIKAQWTKDLLTGSLFGGVGKEATALRAGPLRLLLGWPALFAIALDQIVTHWPEITKAATEAKNAIAARWPEIKDAFFKAMQGDWAGAWVEFSAAAKGAQDELSKDENWKTFFTQLHDYIESTKTDWTNLQTFFASNKLDLAKNSQRELAALADAFSQVIDAMKHDWLELLTFFQKIGSGDFKGAWDMFTQPPKDAAKTLKGVYDQIVADLQAQNARVAQVNKDAEGTIGIGAIDAIKKAAQDGTKEAVADVNKMSDDVREAILRRAGDHVQFPWAEDAMGEMQKVVDAVKAKTAEVQNATKSITVNGKDFAIPLTEAEKAARIYGDALTQAAGAANTLAAATKTITVNGQSFQVPVNGADQLNQAAQGTAKSLDAVSQKAKEITVNGQKFTVPLEQGLDNVSTKSGQAKDALDKNLGTAPAQASQKGADASQGIFDTLWKELGIGSAQASEKVDGELKDIGKDASVSPLAAKMREAFGQIKSDATETAKFVADAFANMNAGGAAAAPAAAPANGAPAASGGDGSAAAPAPSGGFQGIVKAGTDAFETLRRLASEAVKALSDTFSADTTWQPLKDKVTEAATKIKEALGGLTVDWSGLLNGLQDVINQIIQLIKSIGTEADGAASTVEASSNRMVTALNQVAQAAKDAASAVAAVGDGSGNSGSDQAPQVGQDSPGFATGGYISGPGTGTSDSIRAWLSNGEYVIRANAVQKYGKGLLDALNVGRLKLPAFANGGLVSAPSVQARVACVLRWRTRVGAVVHDGEHDAGSGLHAQNGGCLGRRRLSGLVPANIHVNGHTCQ